MTIRSFENHTPVIDQTAFVDSTAVVIGDVVIGKDSSIWPMTVIRGDIHQIRIGSRSSIQDGTVIHVTHSGPFNPGGFPTLIGDEVTVGHKVMLHGCTIRNRVLVGMSAIIMDGVTIESEVVVGGGSLVPPGKTLDSGYLYVGSPVKQIRRLTDKELEYFAYTAGKYVELKDRHKLAQS
ncbi:MAG: gamma carbonic anhydrase family protein [Gammaproteobacteria bacterium]|nr:gamma carbonic anhydrase family protein [Gammaproteobacteria bacterium]MDP2139691.1 gamma carbonic anhydrase family protein [Gammaproteobacteria bacterium]MDP2348895.1 gamma carbonic anhydrase family protein [Gammaproteobacteria bacterium]